MVETSQFQSALSALWQQFAPHPGNRALVIARMLVHHADPATKKIFTDLIERNTPPGKDRDDALKALRPALLFSHIQIVSDAPARIEQRRRVEPEIGRLTVGLDSAAEFRIWIVGRDLTRRDNGSGRISKTALFDELTALKIAYTRRHFNRLLKQGEGLFWIVHCQQIYLRSAPNVARAVFTLAENRGLETETNRPGVREVLLDVSSSLEAWEAQLYAGWIAYRGYKRDLTISRAALSTLFGRHPATIRRWEETRLKEIIQKQPNFAQCGDLERYFDYIPDHAQAYVARIIHNHVVKDVVRVFWQLPNTYHSSIDHHTHKGQAARVRKAVNSDIPASLQRGGHLPLYFTPEQLKKRHRSLKFRMGRSGDVFKPVYVFLGQHRVSQKRVFELTNTGFWFTHPSERVSPHQEDAFFDRQEAKFTVCRQKGNQCS